MRIMIDKELTENQGVVNNIIERKIFRVSRDFKEVIFNSNNIYVSDKNLFGIRRFITVNKYCGNKVVVSEVDRLFVEHLNTGDIILIEPNGRLFKLWNINSSSNVIYTTDFCNSDCIMCPQVIQNKGTYYNDACKVIALLPKTINEICISGGEPTLFKDEYINLLKTCKKELPKSTYIVLTNGKNFEDFEFVKNIIINSPRNMTYAIPIYSANPVRHDIIVGSKNSFNSTLKGVYNLYKFNQSIEIRIVVLKHNYRDLKKLAHFIYWNLPFVNHIAFMGMEVCGNAVKNIEDIWIEPIDYIDYLQEAVEYLDMRMLNVSIYNLPLCVLPKELWKFSRKSISDWKNKFSDSCWNCIKKDDCAGFFSTSVNSIRGINTITNDI